MRIKLDENLGERGKEIFKKYGHDALSVYDQKLESSSDNDLIQICNAEERCIVTLDMDFANPLNYQPSKYNGIAVIRLPKNSSPEDLYSMTEMLAKKCLSSQLEADFGSFKETGFANIRKNKIRLSILTYFPFARKPF